MGLHAASGPGWSLPAPPRLRAVLERATVREILMGAQDNLTNVLAVVLGVTVGSGRPGLVALAGLSAAVAEAVSMGGVLYSATRADQGRERSAAPGNVETALAPPPGDGVPARLSPVLSGLVTFVAAMLAGIVPLVPFAFLSLWPAAVTSVLVSLLALFGLGALTGRISGHVWWRDGLRLIVVAGLAAVAAAVVGVWLQVD